MAHQAATAKLLGGIGVVLLAVLLASCSGGDGGAGPAGPAGPPGTPGIGVTTAATSLQFTVDRITVASPPVVEFTLTNESNIRFVGLAQGQIRFTLAKLVPGVNGNPSAWQSYINRTETKGAGAWGAGGTATQANSESNGTLVNNGDGTYRYTFANNVTNITSPIAVSWQPALTHRLGVQISGGTLPVTNAAYDWRPSDGATAGLASRDIVQTASCNECHAKLALHGGGRTETEYCVTCHNPGTTDANSGNTVDFKVMIHKIHRGEFLPSVEAGGTYRIWGNSDSLHDFSHVAYPQDIRNCTKCHDATDAATPQGGNWETGYSVEACGSCHDDVNFATGAGHTSGAIVAQNGECTICHGAGFAPSAAEAHVIPGKVAGAKYRLNIISVANAGPGQFPVITYEVTDPTNANARYNIMSGSDPAWTNGAVSILLGWNNADHHNQGNGSATTPASAVSLNGRAASTGNNAAPTANADGTFTVTSLRAIPASEAGSGVAGMTARVGADHDGDGSFTDRVPVKSVVKYFAITDATPVARRSVVDIVNNCDDCHDQLTLHGESRTDEPQLCVICHNANNTDIARRPADPTTTVDGLKEQTIDMKVMIHAIHAAGKRENPYVVYGFGSSVNDFSHVGFPGILNNCSACHKPNTFVLPLKDGVLGTTVDSGASRTDHGDDTNVTPTTAVCSACHDSDLAKTHMIQNGGAFTMSGDPGSYNETCAVCHGPGRTADVAEVHAIAP
jgi:OmcA/MtrC family decaheme c-type cytochrome